MKDKALSITTNQVSQMPCIRFKSHTHTQTHQERQREERDFKKKDLLPSAAKNPAKKPLVPVCVKGVWGKRKGGGKSAERILRLFAAQRIHSFKRKKKTMQLMMMVKEQLI